ncbi:MAG TPA: hypothetical protein G4O16_05510 [Dehalococcoidia bacterium]|nr:hypothetical protein [Dehalococcoidia bacterium]
MARRGDYSQRETRKVKKDAKKIPPVDILTTPPPVEVIGKGSKKKKAEEEE